MNTREFLEAVWPTTGPYCLATPFNIPGTSVWTYGHKVFDTISAAAGFIKGKRDSENLFFAIHTLKQPRVFNPAKVDKKTGKLGAYEVRTHGNMSEARAFFFDLDVGPEENKYQTREEALSDLQRFLFETGLPDPLVTSSGGGFHVYWRVSDAIPSVRWKKTAARLHALALHFKMRHDPMRTTDQSSVLRVAGTFNFKNGGKRPVEVLFEGEESDNATFTNAIKSLAAEYNINAADPVPARSVAHGAPQQVAGQLPDNISAKLAYDGQVTTFRQLYRACGNVQKYVKKRGNVSEPVWYNTLGLLQFVRDGDKIIHRFSNGHPGYSAASTDAKVAQFNLKSDGPPTCATLNAKWGGGSACALCPRNGMGSNPLIVANRLALAAPAPPPALTPANAVKIDAASLIDPPKPYKRLANSNGIMHTAMKEKVAIETVISNYDMFPFASFTRTEGEASFSLWAVNMPIEGQQIIKLPNKDIYETRSLAGLLADHSIYIEPKNLSHMGDFMSAYIRKLQAHQKANKQYDHLGWSEEYTKFILPSKILSTDGTEQPGSLSGIAKVAETWISQKGTLANQIANLQFYNHDEYIPHQFAILCALGSPLLFATGLGGGVVSLSGESGASKSTALYAAASMYGPPRKYTIDATHDGSTANARNDRVVTMANLPVLMDEMTNLSPEAIKAFIMHITQYEEKSTMTSNRILRPVRSEAKSMIAIVTSNNSLHQLLSIENTAGIAGTVRVFEMIMPQADKRNKPAADRFLVSLNENHGHIGELFLRGIMPHMATVMQAVRDQVVDFDQRFGLEAYERYYAAMAAAAITAGRISKKAGLIPFNIKKIVEWLEHKQLPYLRGAVKEETDTLSPVSVMAGYIEAIGAETIRVNHCRGNPKMQAFTEHSDHVRVMKAHLDLEAQLLYCRKDAFRDWCVLKSKSPVKVLNYLEAQKVVLRTNIKFMMGKDTPMGKVRSNCFVVDLNAMRAKGKVVAVPNDPTNVIHLPLKKGLPKQPLDLPVVKPNL